ncbi:MAG: hypothetical protein F9K44_05895 [Hyphomicrobiaceae bacterium]|nr:MAG: hypothetical protein F9K44_05895 [Hyphomicrobiaceae bacterium]
MQSRLVPSIVSVLALAGLSLWPQQWIADFASTNRGRSIVASDHLLHASIGRLIGPRICTGALVLHPRIVVTAAHCLLETDGSVTKKSVSFQLGHDSVGAPLIFQGRVERVGSVRQNGDRTVRDEAMDWGIVVLDEAPANVRPLLLKSVSETAAALLAKRISLPAFSIDVAAGRAMTVDQGASILAVRWGVFLHDSGRALGSSGAPLLVDTGEGLAVIGINTACIYETRPHKGGQIEMLHVAVRASSFEAAVRAVRARLPPPISTVVAVPPPATVQPRPVLARDPSF